MSMNRSEKPSKIRKICVYCGSGPGIDPAFVESARAFGTLLAKNGIGLVFGGGSVGMMGAIAKSVREHGGEVTGIIPEFLVAREHAMRGADNLIVTRDMHERKRKMFEMADAFVAMPGGVGTLEEVVEQMTWVQLGRHRKPILLANIKHFWDPLCSLINHMKALEFIRDDLNFDLLVADKVDDILPMLKNAAAAVSEEEKEMPAVIADRL
ncbi:MAG: TIGR00730 family Rossman fold protein [Pseudolabrys sp.]